MMRRLVVLAIVVGFVAAVGFNLPDLALLAFGVLLWGVWYATIRAERGRA
jgi:uncharacterized protein YqgC (DUF456 family)